MAQAARFGGLRFWLNSPHETVPFNSHWEGLQPSARQLVREELLPQLKEFKYLCVLFMKEVKNGAGD